MNKIELVSPIILSIYFNINVINKVYGNGYHG